MGLLPNLKAVFPIEPLNAFLSQDFTIDDIGMILTEICGIDLMKDLGNTIGLNKDTRVSNNGHVGSRPREFPTEDDICNEPTLHMISRGVELKSCKK